MTTFNKQDFEDRLYEMTTAEVNAVLPALMRAGGDVLKFQRQLLQAFHGTIEETVVQVLHGVRLMDKVQHQTQLNKEEE